MREVNRETLVEKINYLSAVSKVGLSLNDEYNLAAYKMLLTAMDSEPYGFTDGDRRGMIYKPEHSDRLSEPVPVYRHAQQSVVPDDVASAIKNLKNTLVDCNRYNYCSDAVERVENACRAAMLNQK